MDEFTVSAEAAKRILSNVQRMMSGINELDGIGIATVSQKAAAQLIAAAKVAYPIVAGARLAAAYGSTGRPEGMTHETWKLQSDWACTALRNALYAAGIEVED